MRQNTPSIYNPNEEFPIGGSKTLRENTGDRATVVVAGATVYEALEAHDRLREQGLNIRVIDACSIKPMDRVTLLKAAEDTGPIVSVEDNYAEGGLGEAVSDRHRRQTNSSSFHGCAQNAKERQTR
jgi:transketolase